MKHSTPGGSSRIWTIGLVGFVVILICLVGVESVGGAVTERATAKSGTATTVTLGSGISNVSGQDLDTSLCVEPEVGGTPISSITSDPAAGSYTCGISPPVNPYIVTSTGSPWKYWGSPTGVGPGPTSIAGAGTQWVGENANGDSVDDPSTGDLVQTYIYDAEVNVPCLPPKSTAKTVPTITGKMATDNASYAYLNGNQIGTMPYPADPVTNFEKATTVGPAVASDWVAGTNTIDFVVHDDGQGTGIDYSLTIKIPKVDESCGTLKICKVAGFGVTVGTPFTFNYTTASGSGTVNVPAGPAPGGYCVVVGTFSTGSYKITEVIPAGDNVTSITGIPTGTPNLGAGTFAGTLKAGLVTEVTYTDQSIPKGEATGYLEICKQVQPSPVAPPSLFVFTVDGQTIDVPTGACSPAIEVLAGSVTATETPIPPYVIVASSTIPAANLVSFNSSSATVTVAPGGVSAETILTVTNGTVSST